MICKSYDGQRLNCNVEKCGKFFHQDCLKNGLWPQAQLNSGHLTCPGELYLNYQQENIYADESLTVKLCGPYNRVYLYPPINPNCRTAK
jgi:hypothetical protein